MPPQTKPAPRRAHGVRRLTLSVGGFLVLLLVVPAVALSQLAPEIDWRVLLGAPLLLSLFAYFSYRSDKQRAETGEWRIPESTLHLIALLGGWPGAFLAQRWFRHKTAKLSFQFVFWAIVLLHQLLALDSLLGWTLSRHTLRFLKSLGPLFGK